MKAELIATSGEVVAEVELKIARHAVIMGHRCFLHEMVCMHGPMPLRDRDARYMEIDVTHIPDYEPSSEGDDEGQD